jgi:hypothetical protein
MPHVLLKIKAMHLDEKKRKKRRKKGRNIEFIDSWNKYCARSFLYIPYFKGGMQ